MFSYGNFHFDSWHSSTKVLDKKVFLQNCRVPAWHKISFGTRTGHSTDCTKRVSYENTLRNQLAGLSCLETSVTALQQWSHSCTCTDDDNSETLTGSTQPLIVIAFLLSIVCTISVSGKHGSVWECGESETLMLQPEAVEHHQGDEALSGATWFSSDPP